MNQDKLIRIFDKQANGYEKRRKNQSQAKWREKLLSSAKGKVLEVAVGAGANFQYYPRGDEVTAVDFSGEMLKKAKAAAIEEGMDAQFIHSDVESLSFEDYSFDTIISTLSLCGYENPMKVLNLMKLSQKSPSSRNEVSKEGTSGFFVFYNTNLKTKK